MKQTNKNANTKKQRRSIYIGIAFIAVFAMVAIWLLSGLKGGTPETALESPANTYTQPSPAASAADTQDLVIQKSDITETADFIAYQAGDTNMEVIAVRASDGTIRTALNTCQVCYDSGRGYYVQEGGEMVCQNCGNRFGVSEIGDTRFGCNPVPITAQYQSEDDRTITISGEFLAGNAELFERWKS
jgi:Predicted membrane protein